MTKYYGYLHVNLEIIVKKYNRQLDIDTATQSKFVLKVYNPVEAKNEKEALKIFENIEFN